MRDLARLLALPEGQYFERKSLWHGSPQQRQTRDRREVRNQIAVYVAAFANADGGTLVMGVEDDGTPTGHGYPEQSWLRLPELRADEHSFAIVLRNQPIFETPAPEWAAYVRNLPIATRQKRILLAYPQGNFGNSEYQNLNDVDRDAAYRELKELVDMGLLHPSGSRGRGARYGMSATIRSSAAASLTPHRVVAARMRERGFIQNSDFREIFGLARDQAKRELNRLVEEEVLCLTGRGRGAHYIPASKWHEWVSLRNPSNRLPE
jgi:predicted HTH transcriptional regulator